MAKKATVTVRVRENGGIHEGGEFFAKGATLELSESRAAALGDSVEIVTADK